MGFASGPIGTKILRRLCIQIEKKIMSRTDVSDQFRNNILRYERIRYNLNVMCDSLHA